MAETDANTAETEPKARPESDAETDIPIGAGLPDSVDATRELLRKGDYIAETSLATALFLALELGRPLLLEGEAGVGKTEIAKVLAQQLDRRLIRLQCYEGLDLASAVYEWNYSRQMIEIRIAEARGASSPVGTPSTPASGQPSSSASPDSLHTLGNDIFDRRFLLERPLLQALQPDPRGAPVLLIDELDRTDEPFEAFLLEILSDFQITIPEIGTLQAEKPPIVIITSNRTREIHDALKRRCFYHWIDYPDAEREQAIIALKVPRAPERLRQHVVHFVQTLRASDLFKLPGVAETLDWTEALVALDRHVLDPDTVDATLGMLLKYQDDIARIRGDRAAEILAQAPDPRES